MDAKHTADDKIRWMRDYRGRTGGTLEQARRAYRVAFPRAESDDNYIMASGPTADDKIRWMRDYRGRTGGTLEQARRAYRLARRLRACRDACEGIPTEALEAGVVTELLAALESAVDILDGFTDDDGIAARDRAYAAIAKAKPKGKAHATD